MRSFDLTPLYRSTVGFDQIADLMDRVFASETPGQSYPPYNIEKTAEDGWRISIAVFCQLSRLIRGMPPGLTQLISTSLPAMMSMPTK